MDALIFCGIVGLGLGFWGGIVANEMSQAIINKENQSKVALQWLHYVHLTEGTYIQHARNKGEKQIGKYKVDGYDAKNQIIYSFNGCYFHGWVKCYPNRKTVNNTLMTPMSELYTCTQVRKSNSLLKCGNANGRPCSKP